MQLNKLKNLPEYRVCERLRIVRQGKEGGAGEHAILVYNNHQPASENNDFPRHARVMFCKTILQDMMRQSSDETRIVGAMFCGDANCNQQHWFTALCEYTEWEMVFKRPRLLFANLEAAHNPIRRKSGDVTAVVSFKGEDFVPVQEDCRVPNREKQRDVTVATWWYRARPMEHGL